MRNILKYLFMLSFLLITVGCNTDELKPSMVEFDQAFIPVFYYAYIGDLESAPKAMLVLDRKWDKLKTKFDNISGYTHNGLESFQMIGNWLEEADAAIRNKDLPRALVQLDHARYELMDFRWREGMSYYLDKVWDLEAAIDIVVQTSSDPMMDLIEWQEFIPMCYDVEEAWNEVLQTPLDENLFGFTPSGREVLEDRHSRLNYAILNFMTSIEYADNCKLAAAAKKMETAYLDYLYLFGDFESSKSLFASIRGNELIDDIQSADMMVNN
ncbi:MAG: hypothetical protein ACI8P3_001942 [Saprospiraceae bacterium]|jgi:hypothetical protein